MLALPAKKLGLVAVAVTAWLLVQLPAHVTRKVAEEAAWDLVYAKYQLGQPLTLSEGLAIQHLEHTDLPRYLKLAAAQLAQDSSVSYESATSRSMACKMALLTAVMDRGSNMLSQQEARAFKLQVVGLYRHLLASHILIKRAHLVAADLAMDSAAGSLGYRWSEFTQLVYRVQQLGKDSASHGKTQQRLCTDELSVLRRLFDSGLVTLPGLLEYYDADLRDEWLQYMASWYHQSMAHRLADAGQMEVVERVNAAGQREALVLWAFPVSFQAPNSMMWSHTLDLYSFDGFHGWRLVVDFKDGCVRVGLLPDRPPGRDHTLVAIYTPFVMDEHGDSLELSCETEPEAYRTHYVRAAKGTRQPVLLPWDQCIPFPPASPDGLPARGELAIVAVLQDVTVAAAACEVQHCELEDLLSRLPTAAELVLRSNVYYRHAPRKFLTAWGLPPGSPGFVRSATLDSQALHEAWGLIRGGPGQRTFWVPGDPQLPPPPPWGRAAGEGSIVNDDSSCGADGATEAGDSEEECYCEDECVEEGGDGSEWYEPPLEEVAEGPPGRHLAAAAPAAGVSDGVVQPDSQPPSSRLGGSLVDIAPRCTPPRVKALLAAKAATREAAAWDGEQKLRFILGQLFRVDCGEAVGMAWCWLRAQIPPQLRALLGVVPLIGGLVFLVRRSLPNCPSFRDEPLGPRVASRAYALLCVLGSSEAWRYLEVELLCFAVLYKESWWAAVIIWNMLGLPKLLHKGCSDPLCWSQSQMLLGAFLVGRWVIQRECWPIPLWVTGKVLSTHHRDIIVHKDAATLAALVGITPLTCFQVRAWGYHTDLGSAPDLGWRARCYANYRKLCFLAPALVITGRLVGSLRHPLTWTDVSSTLCEHQVDLAAVAVLWGCWTRVVLLCSLEDIRNYIGDAYGRIQLMVGRVESRKGPWVVWAMKGALLWLCHPWRPLGCIRQLGTLHAHQTAGPIRTALSSPTLEEWLKDSCLTSHTLRILMRSGLASLEDARRSLNFTGFYLVESDVLFPLLLYLAVEVFVGLLTAMVLWTLVLPWRLSCLALRLPLWLNDIIWGLPFWILGRLGRLVGRAVPPRTSAVVQKALEEGLAAVFVTVQRARTAAAAAVHALRQGTLARAPPTAHRDISGKKQSHTGGSAKGRSASGRRGRGQGKASSRHRQYQQAPALHSATVSEVDPVPEEASDLRDFQEGTQPDPAQQQHLANTSSAGTARDSLTENSSSNYELAYEQLGAAKASERQGKPGGAEAATPAAAGVVQATAGSSAEEVARGAALAAPSATPQMAGHGEGNAGGTVDPTMAHTQQAAEETQLVPQPIPLPAAAAAPSQPAETSTLIPNMRRRGRAGRAGSQARVSVERVRREHEASQGPAARPAAPEGAQPSAEAAAAAAVQQPHARAAPVIATSSSRGSRAGQQLLAALQAAAPQAESHALATQQSQGSRARYNPLLSTSSSGSVAPISSQQHDMVPSRPAPWLPGEQGTEAAGLPWPAATAAAPPPIASLQPELPSAWPGVPAPPPSFASPFFPPAAASHAVNGVLSQPSPPGSSGIPPSVLPAAAGLQQTSAGALGSPVQQAGLGTAAAPGNAAIASSTGLPPGQVLQHQLPMPIPLPAAATNPEGSVHSSHAGDLTGAAEAECVLCWDAARETTLAPCGHRALCLPCTDMLLRTAGPQCPICRRAVRSYICREYDA